MCVIVVTPPSLVTVVPPRVSFGHPMFRDPLHSGNPNARTVVRFGETRKHLFVPLPPESQEDQ
jgi:hypothetical protein